MASGTVTADYRVPPTDAERAMTALSQAGFRTRQRSDEQNHPGVSIVTAERHYGMANPSAPLQRFHMWEAEQALTAAGVTHQAHSHGIVMVGGTPGHETYEVRTPSNHQTGLKILAADQEELDQQLGSIAGLLGVPRDDLALHPTPAFIPSPAEAVALPIDELAIRLLRWLAQRDRPVSRSTLTDVAAWQGADTAEVLPNFVMALAEAWDWLTSHGLLSRQAGPVTDDLWFVTRLGRDLARDDKALPRLRATQRLDVDLHPRLSHRIRPQFLLGEYELASFAALREVEIRVRELTSASNADYGVKLMDLAFREGGPLSDPALEPSEREATKALYRGAIGVFKNPPSHRQVEFDDPTQAAEVVLFADLLLRLLDQLAHRLNLPPEAPPPSAQSPASARSISPRSSSSSPC